MANNQTITLTTYVERARKVLLYEQRLNHQDQAIKPGGVEAFITRWYADTSVVCHTPGEDTDLLQRFVKNLTGYHQQDPVQRAASIRAALSILNELEAYDKGESSPRVAKSGNYISKADNTSKTDTKKERTEEINNPILSRHQQNVTVPEPVKAVRQVKPASVSPEKLDPIRLEAGMSQGHSALTLLSADITVIPGVGPTAATRLHTLGIRTVKDLLFYFPREHRDYSKLEKIAQIPFDEVTTTMGMIWDVKTVHTANKRTRTIATISDETGKLYISWFNQPYLQKQLQAAQNNYIVVTGIKQRFGNKVEFSVRTHELPEQGDLLNTGRMVPIYPLTEGLSAKVLRRFTKYVIDRYAKMLQDHLPFSVLEEGHLMMLPKAIEQIHYPENEELRAIAHHRLAFDELFILQLGMQERRSRWQEEAKDGNAFTRYDHRIFVEPGGNGKASSSPGTQKTPALGATLWSVIATDDSFEATLPYSFTDAQRRVILEIFADLSQSRPMSRLLQGDVGAGKTAVAAAALLLATLNGYQGAIMAPTELLAEQHARSIGTMLEPFGIKTVLLTGSQRPRERTQARLALENGQAAIAIGTHALIQDDVKFHSLGLVIVDEQHRFGVEQRDALRQKGLHPHMLVMTATPIPRTLALTLYGDLDVSVIDQLPPGRQKIITRWRTGTRRSESNQLIEQQVAEGRQAFIICPLIEESETLTAKAATSEYERLQGEVFPHLRIGLLHGAMKSVDKDQVMHSFRDHEIDILVATSVIEVGIDIPNATVMVIEDADRFGLSQLHQFRGRVGRGKHQSYCYVLSAEASIQAQERLGVFQETDDGFKLSEEDLRLRGPGDFIGVRQSGMPELRIANLSDTRLIEQTRRAAERLWQSDPYLRQPAHAALRERMHLFWYNYMAH